MLADQSCIAMHSKDDLAVDQRTATVPHLPQAANGLHPAKHLFDQLPPALTGGIADVPCGAAIDRPTRLLGRDMGRDSDLGVRG
jgi:hypothetical protein